MNTSDSNTTGKKLAKAGAWMQLAILVGMLGTVIGMSRAFETLGTARVSDPSHLSAAIGHVLWSTAAGGAVAAIGAIVMCYAVFATPFRARRFFWLLIASGTMWTAAFAPVGLLLLAAALIKRHEFFPEKLSMPTSPA